MEKFEFSGKNYDEAVKNAKESLQELENDLIIKEIESTKGLFNKKVVIAVIRKRDISDLIKDYIKELTKNIGLDINIEIKRREDAVNFIIYADNSAILIGRNGKNIEALNTIVKQMLINELGEYYKFNIDINDYKEKKQENLVRMAKKIAKEVSFSKIEAKLDPMNSYERRLIHNELSKNKYVYTESIGEEPNRCIVIKPKEDK